jgi:hypothetical protein
VHAVKGEYDNDSGFCVYIRPDGDQFFKTYQAAGKLGVASKGTAKIVGGSGKLAGIQGTSEITRINVKPAAPGTIQVINRVTDHYKLP